MSILKSLEEVRTELTSNVKRIETLKKELKSHIENVETIQEEKEEVNVDTSFAKILGHQEVM